MKRARADVLILGTGEEERACPAVGGGAEVYNPQLSKYWETLQLMPS